MSVRWHLISNFCVMSYLMENLSLAMIPHHLFLCSNHPFILTISKTRTVKKISTVLMINSSKDKHIRTVLNFWYQYSCKRYWLFCLIYTWLWKIQFRWNFDLEPFIVLFEYFCSHNLILNRNTNTASVKFDGIITIQMVSTIE